MHTKTAEVEHNSWNMVQRWSTKEGGRGRLHEGGQLFEVRF